MTQEHVFKRAYVLVGYLEKMQRTSSEKVALKIACATLVVAALVLMLLIEEE
jgi:hypothetical protein